MKQSVCGSTHQVCNCVEWVAAKYVRIIEVGQLNDFPRITQSETKKCTSNCFNFH